MNINITISEPKEIFEGKLKGNYFCQVCLTNIKKYCSIYAVNSIEAVNNTNKFAEEYLQERIKNLEFFLSVDKEKLTEELK